MLLEEILKNKFFWLAACGMAVFCAVWLRNKSKRNKDDSPVIDGILMFAVTAIAIIAAAKALWSG